MAIDERRTSPTRAAEPSDPARGGRSADWSTFWDDPLFNFWRGGSRRGPRHDPWLGGSRRSVGPAWDEPEGDWTPAIETFQRGDEFVVRADLPGMKRADIMLHATNGALTIEGERRSEQEEQRGGFYRTERSYGRFCRVVPLPQGALVDGATATFANGVLEIVMKAPAREVARGQKIEIREADGIPDLSTSPIYPE